MEKTEMGVGKWRIVNVEREEYARECGRSKDFLAGVFVKPLIVSVSDAGITRARFVDCGDGYEPLEEDWRELPLIVCATEFAEKVYRALLEVKPGETISYSALAAKAGSPGAARAVGSVMAGNRHPWLIPCHRVVKTDGRPGNYTVGEECSCADLKQQLINFEKGILSLESELSENGSTGSDVESCN